MALKAILDSLDGLDEGLKALYTQRATDNKYVLGVEGELPGFVSKTRLDEFRNNNTSLQTEIDQLKSDAEGNKERLERLKKLEALVEEDEEKQLLADGKLDEVVERRVEKRTSQMRRELEGQIKAKDTAIDALTGERDTALGSFNNLMIDTSINDAINEIGGVRKGALTDVRSRGRRVFQMKDEKLTALDGDGNMIYGASGSDPLSPKEWVEGLLETAPHLFEESSGGGAGGRKGGDKPPPGGNKNVRMGDSKAFSSNLEDIASGKVRVVR